MFKKINKTLFLILLVIFVLLVIAGFYIALGLDDGRPVPKVLQWMPYAFIVLRYPSWPLFVDTHIPYTIFLISLVLNCMIYAYLTERLVFCLGNVIRRARGNTVS